MDCMDIDMFEGICSSHYKVRHKGYFSLQCSATAFCGTAQDGNEGVLQGLLSLVACY